MRRRWPSSYDAWKTRSPDDELCLGFPYDEPEDEPEEPPEEEEASMEVKCLELRDAGTFIPVICLRPVPANEAQRYLLRRDGYRGDDSEHCIILIKAQCRGVAYDCYDWPANPRTFRVAHDYIANHWFALEDGDVIDVEFILGETAVRKVSEREGIG